MRCTVFALIHNTFFQHRSNIVYFVYYYWFVYNIYWIDLVEKNCISLWILLFCPQEFFHYHRIYNMLCLYPINYHYKVMMRSFQRDNIYRQSFYNYLFHYHKMCNNNLMPKKYLFRMNSYLSYHLWYNTVSLHQYNILYYFLVIILFK